MANNNDHHGNHGRIFSDGAVVDDNAIDKDGGEEILTLEQAFAARADRSRSEPLELRHCKTVRLLLQRESGVSVCRGGAQRVLFAHGVRPGWGEHVTCCQVRTRYNHVFPPVTHLVSDEQIWQGTSAWSMQRMHNMIMTVGPTTPAAVLDKMRRQQEENAQPGATAESDEDEDDDEFVYIPGVDPMADMIADQVMDTVMERMSDLYGGADAARVALAVMHPQGRAELHAMAGSLVSQIVGGMRRDGQRRHGHGGAATAAMDDTIGDYYATMSHSPGASIMHTTWLDAPSWQVSVQRQSTTSTSPSCAVQQVSLPSSWGRGTGANTTQLLTAGDDGLLKIWDVRETLDGTHNAVPGGWNTLTAFSQAAAPLEELPPDWVERFGDTSMQHTPGSVQLLQTLRPDHESRCCHHAMPVWAHPGKILSCGGEGNLCLNDIETNSSTVLFSCLDLLSEYERTNPFQHRRRSAAYQAAFMTPETGVVATHLGLFPFDLRVSPSEHRSRDYQRLSLTNWTAQSNKASTWSRPGCLAVVPWSPHHGKMTQAMSTNYLFVGGASTTVLLLDWRKRGVKSLIQRYNPEALAGPSEVLVQSLDVSKNGRELLVSYSQDHIYKFRIADWSPEPDWEDSPHLTEKTLQECGRNTRSNGEQYVTSEERFCGHLTETSGVKACFAGPSDEYICTGSTTGHAWIYNRESYVASFLAADERACAGLVPHPTLPVFATFGYAPSAKLWRATLPVDITVDDSDMGRYKTFLHRQCYQPSISSGGWEKLQQALFPSPTMCDNFPNDLETMYFGDHHSDEAKSLSWISPDANSIEIGNAMQRLLSVLRLDVYRAYASVEEDVPSPPVCSRVDLMLHTVQGAQLYYQARAVGMRLEGFDGFDFCGDEELTELVGAHSCDEIPDHPSCWLMRDFQMDEQEIDDESEIYMGPGFLKQEADVDMQYGEMVDHLKNNQRFLGRTAELCRDGGDKALTAGLHDLAARRYDKAILYCATGLLRCPVVHDRFGYLWEDTTLVDLSDNSSWPTAWTQLVEVLITTRLRMSKLLLELEMPDHEEAKKHAEEALRIVSPFVQKKGQVIIRKIVPNYIGTNEPGESYDAARKLQAESLFRLGCANLALMDVDEAVDSLERAISIRRTASKDSPDPLWQAKLDEAREHQDYDGDSMPELEGLPRDCRARDTGNMDVDDDDNSMPELLPISNNFHGMPPVREEAAEEIDGSDESDDGDDMAMEDFIRMIQEGPESRQVTFERFFAGTVRSHGGLPSFGGMTESDDSDRAEDDESMPGLETVPGTDLPAPETSQAQAFDADSMPDLEPVRGRIGNVPVTATSREASAYARRKGDDDSDDGSMPDLVAIPLRVKQPPFQMDRNISANSDGNPSIETHTDGKNRGKKKKTKRKRNKRLLKQKLGPSDDNGSMVGTDNEGDSMLDLEPLRTAVPMPSSTRQPCGTGDIHTESVSERNSVPDLGPQTTVPHGSRTFPRRLTLHDHSRLPATLQAGERDNDRRSDCDTVSHESMPALKPAGKLGSARPQVGQAPQGQNESSERERKKGCKNDHDDGAPDLVPVVRPNQPAVTIVRQNVASQLLRGEDGVMLDDTYSDGDSSLPELVMIERPGSNNQGNVGPAESAANATGAKKAKKNQKRNQCRRKHKRKSDAGAEKEPVDADISISADRNARAVDNRDYDGTLNLVNPSGQVSASFGRIAATSKNATEGNINDDVGSMSIVRTASDTGAAGQSGSTIRCNQDGTRSKSANDHNCGRGRSHTPPQEISCGAVTSLRAESSADDKNFDASDDDSSIPHLVAVQPSGASNTGSPAFPPTAHVNASISTTNMSAQQAQTSAEQKKKKKKKRKVRRRKKKESQNTNADDTDGDSMPDLVSSAGVAAKSSGHSVAADTDVVHAAAKSEDCNIPEFSGSAAARVRGPLRGRQASPAHDGDHYYDDDVAGAEDFLHALTMSGMPMGHIMALMQRDMIMEAVMGAFGDDNEFHDDDSYEEEDDDELEDLDRFLHRRRY